MRDQGNNYLTYIMAYMEAQDRGADVAILRDPEGLRVRRSRYDLFTVHDGRLLVP